MKQTIPMSSQDLNKVGPHLSRVSTGIPGLDDILKGGLPSDHLYLLEGDPGTGKTTLALQFLLKGLAEGENGLYITLSESKRELEAIAASHGWSLEGLAIYEMTALEDVLSPEAQYTVFHPSEVELSNTINSILEIVRNLQPRRIVLDSLSEMRVLARDALRYRRQILGLKGFFAGRNTTVLMLDDHTGGESDLQLHSIAHGVIILQSIERPYGIKRRRLEIRKLRGSRFREGFHDFCIRVGGLVVYPRLVAAEHRRGFDHYAISSGDAELDRLLGGGIDRGTSTLLIGPAGSGKSTVAARYALAAAKRGEVSAIFCFDESPTTMLFRMKSLGMDLEPFIESELIRIEQIDPAEMSPGEFIHKVRNYVQDLDARVIVLDSVNGFLNAMPDEQYLILQMHEMLSYLGQQGVITLLTMAQHGFLGSSMSSPVDVSYLADVVVLLRFFESEGHIRQAVSIMKKRSGVHERTIRELKFSTNGMHVGLPLQQFEGVLTGTPRFKGTTRDLELRDLAHD